MIQVDKFKAEDYGEVYRDSPGGITWWTDAEPTEVGHLLQENALMYTMREDETILGIFGGVFPREGMCEIGFIPGAGWLRKKFAIIRVMKQYLTIPVKDCTRVQATCLADIRFVKFAELFGFQVEGLLRKYDRLGRDYFMMSIVKED